MSTLASRVPLPGSRFQNFRWAKPYPGQPIMDKTPQNVSLVVLPEIRVPGRPARPRYMIYLPAASVGYVSRVVKHMESIRNPYYSVSLALRPTHAALGHVHPSAACPDI